MTTAPPVSSNETLLNTAGASLPWTQRNLEIGTKVMDDLRIAKANKRAADAAEKQALSAFKAAKAEGQLDEFFDDLAEQFCAPGLTVTITSSERYGEKCYSAGLQEAMQAERENGTAKPTTYEVFRVTLDD